MQRNLMTLASSLLAAVALALLGGVAAAAADKPNIVVIMGDDVGWFNIGPCGEEADRGGDQEQAGQLAEAVDSTGRPARAARWRVTSCKRTSPLLPAAAVVV